MHFNSTIFLKAQTDIASARREYDTLPDQEWRKDFFSEETGGFLVTSWKRIEEAATKNEPEKLETEHAMCLVFAKGGFKVRHYQDDKTQGSFDVMINNYRADLKKTRSTNNIIRYAKHGLRVQNAEIILIEFENWGNEFRDIVSEMSRKGIHGYYFVTGDELIHSF